jgi:dTDP-4-amino-4,6-dideoxygalactose transaminase
MIPIMKPKLPSADKLLPYLTRIDENRWYSNFGKLNAEYEELLSDIFKCHVVTCSSATSGLTAALMAILPFNYKTRAMVGMPSWTFAATASAIFAAGFRPLICDVQNRNGFKNVLDTNSAGGCRAFVPVMPLGMPIDLVEWATFAEEFCPVVVDGAAAFHSLARGAANGMQIGKVPIVVSTHSTKVLSTAEGGFVLSQDKEFINKVRMILNQGMRPDKSVAHLGFNGKLSEYHAAIGLAELDNWPNKRDEWIRVQIEYGEQTDYATSTHDVLLPSGVEVEKIVQEMYKRGIMCRSSWYGICHLQDAYTKVWFDGMGSEGKLNMPMKRTEDLRKRTIFLPKFVDMTKSDIDYIKENLEFCLKEYL